MANKSHSSWTGDMAMGNKVKLTYTEFLDQSPMTGFLWLLLCGLCLAQLLDGLDFQSIAFALPGILHQFHLTHAEAGVIPALTNVGLAIGALFLPALCDRVGRKLIFQWVLLTYAFGALICALAPSFNVLLIGRFIAGIGLGAQFPIAWAMLAEYSPVRLRHVFLPLAPMFFAVGWIVVALLSLWLIPAFGWRAIFWVGIVPAAMIVYVRRFLPESIRFLLSTGQVEEAGRIAHQLAKRAGIENVELVPPPLQGAEGKLSFSQQLKLLRNIWGPMLVLVVFMFCSFIQTFALNAWLPTIFMRQGFRLTTSFAYTLIILVATPISQIIAIWLHNRIDRKWALFIMAAGGTVFFVLFGLSFEYHWPIAVMVGSQVVQTLFAQGVPAILFTLSSELVPTPVRTLGLGIISGMGRFGAVLGPFILGLFLHFGTKISDIIYLFAIPLFIASILALLVIKIDPRGLSLEQIGEKERKGAGRTALGLKGGRCEQRRHAATSRMPSNCWLSLNTRTGGWEPWLMTT